ncbi:enolase-phosphatase E-1-like protein 3, partial [Leptotrombidium deliense]
ECFNQKEFRLAVNFAKAYKPVPGKKQPPPIADQMQPPNVQLESIVQHFLWRLQNEGSVSAPIAYFLLNMTSWGYERGLLVTPVYEEVAATLKKWCEQDKIKLYVTLGSAQFLKRVFSRTSSGNLIGFIEGHMNLMVGGSRKDFTFLANLLKQKEDDILFITRFPQDARQAKAAKINPIIILRADFDPRGVELLKNKDKPGAPEPKAEAAAPSSSAEMTAESKVTSQDIRDFQVVTRLDDIH